MNSNPKTAFITGGASGIGFAFVEIFLKRKTKVAIFDLRIPETVKQALLDLAATYDTEIVFHIINICDLNNFSKAAKQATEQIGTPEFALNCAGMLKANKFLEMEVGEFEQVINVNIIGSKNFATALLPLMQPGSHLAFVASLAGLVSNYSYASYCASKYAIVGLAGVLRIEQQERDISISVICPPEILTPMVEEELKTMHPIARELKSFAGTIPLDSSCQYVFKQLTKPKFLIIPGFKARIVWYLSRFVPGLLQRDVDKVVAKHNK